MIISDNDRFRFSQFTGIPMDIVPY